jgi:hypothetical protein
MVGFSPSATQVRDFLHGFELCVVATLGKDGRPQTATVAFSENDALQLVIGTSVHSRKSDNLERDSRLAMTVTDPDQRYTVQYEGIARRLSSVEMLSFHDQHYGKLPGSLPFKDLPDQAFFLITPTYVRFSDCSIHPWLLTEISI